VLDMDVLVELVISELTVEELRLLPDMVVLE
jgi:hypothetical protein